MWPARETKCPGRFFEYVFASIRRLVATFEGRARYRSQRLALERRCGRAANEAGEADRASLVVLLVACRIRLLSHCIAVKMVPYFDPRVQGTWTVLVVAERSIDKSETGKLLVKM